MGYIRDDGLSVLLGPNDCLVSAGTWADTLTSGVWSKKRTAAAAPFYLAVVGRLLQHSDEQMGSYLKTVDLYWKVGTAALTSLAATVGLVTLPANGSAFEAPVSQAFLYDSLHDQAASRVTADEHKMTLTLSSPFWVASDKLVQVELAVSAPGTSVFEWYGAAFGFALRL